MKLSIDPVRIFLPLILALCFLLFVAWAVHVKNKAAKFDNVVAKLENTEESAEISRETSELASQSNQEHQYEVVEDRRAVAAARSPTASPDDHARLQDRINEAYAVGLCAESRLQRADCGPVVSPAAADK